MSPVFRYFIQLGLLYDQELFPCLGTTLLVNNKFQPYITLKHVKLRVILIKIFAFWLLFKRPVLHACGINWSLLIKINISFTSVRLNIEARFYGTVYLLSTFADE